MKDMNNQAYIDVLEQNGPSYPNNEYYMACYYRWMNLVPDEDPITEDDWIDLYSLEK